MSSRLVVLVALAMYFACALPARAANAPSAELQGERGAAVTPASSSDDGSFIDRYFPLSLPDNLEPEVEQNVTIVWVASIFLVSFWAPLWAPIVFFGEGAPESYFSDVIVSGLLHYATHFIPVVNFAMIPLNCFYFCPVAVISIYDRNLKKKRGKRVSAERDAPLRSRLAQTEVVSGAMPF